MNISVLEFFIENLKIEEFENKKTLEVGSKYVNGSVRSIIEKFFKLKKYVGTDIEEGKFVDIICNAENLIDCFDKNSFDVVISTELLEHVKDWRKVINNMKDVLKPNGYIYITTRSKGFPFHAFPYDFWRYEIEDMKKIFADFNIIKLQNDPEAKGIFLKAQKPINYNLINLEKIKLYSMILGKRTNFTPNFNQISYFRKIKLFLYEFLKSFKNLANKLLQLK